MSVTTDMQLALRQILAVLENERQALAGLDLSGIVSATQSKHRLCDAIEMAGVQQTTLDEECRAMLESARRLNEVNRQVRNLVAANVDAQLDAITGAPGVYHAATYRIAGQAAL